MTSEVFCGLQGSRDALDRKRTTTKYYSRGHKKTSRSQLRQRNFSFLVGFTLHMLIVHYPFHFIVK